MTELWHGNTKLSEKYKGEKENRTKQIITEKKKTPIASQPTPEDLQLLARIGLAPVT